jgi:hypothetical protein
MQIRREKAEKPDVSTAGIVYRIARACVVRRQAKFPGSGSTANSVVVGDELNRSPAPAGRRLPGFVQVFMLGGSYVACQPRR